MIIQITIDVFSCDNSYGYDLTKIYYITICDGNSDSEFQSSDLYSAQIIHNFTKMQASFLHLVCFVFSALLAHAARIGMISTVKKFFVVTNSGADDDMPNYAQIHSDREEEQDARPLGGGLVVDWPRTTTPSTQDGEQHAVCKLSPQLVSDMEELASHDAVAGMLPRMIPPGLVDDVWSLKNYFKIKKQISEVQKSLKLKS